MKKDQMWAERLLASKSIYTLWYLPSESRGCTNFCSCFSSSFLNFFIESFKDRNKKVIWLEIWQKSLIVSCVPSGNEAIYYLLSKRLQSNIWFKPMISKYLSSWLSEDWVRHDILECYQSCAIEIQFWDYQDVWHSWSVFFDLWNLSRTVKCSGCFD